MSDRESAIDRERAACRSKRRFPNRREAEEAAYRIRLEGTELDVYECIWCRGWHLTSRGGGTG